MIHLGANTLADVDVPQSGSRDSGGVYAQHETAVVSCCVISMWKNGKIIRSTDTYVAWAKAIAESEHVPFIDLNDLTANNFEALEADKTSVLFPGDHTHTNMEGAKLNAKTVVRGLKILKDCPITADLK